MYENGRLKVGMELQGTVRNVVDFGAFVDIGVKQDGLSPHLKTSKTGIKHPLEVVSLGDIVTVWVEKVEIEKGRIALTMIPPEKQVNNSNKVIYKYVHKTVYNLLFGIFEV